MKSLAAVNLEVVFALVSTVAPQITGTATAGQTLTCSEGSWAPQADAFSYQWLRGGAPIAGANATSYTVQIADVGSSVSCQVTAKNATG